MAQAVVATVSSIDHALYSKLSEAQIEPTAGNTSEEATQMHLLRLSRSLAPADFYSRLLETQDTNIMLTETDLELLAQAPKDRKQITARLERSPASFMNFTKTDFEKMRRQMYPSSSSSFDENSMSSTGY
ncbi:Protein of unknown function [Gryllus bimaculatus]|nr:Protein of unknown function [Gryllus bimaculatus]